MRAYAAGTALIALALAGCAALERDVVTGSFTGPNQQSAYMMTCSGGGRSLTKCYAKAAQLCPSGYSVISQTTSSVTTSNKGDVFTYPLRELVVECKEAKSQTAPQ